MPRRSALSVGQLIQACASPSSEFEITIRHPPGAPTPTEPGVRDGLGPAHWELLPARELKELGLTAAEARAYGAAWQKGYDGLPFKSVRPLKQYRHLRYNWLMGRKDRRDDESHGRIERMLLPPPPPAARAAPRRRSRRTAAPCS